MAEDMKNDILRKLIAYNPMLSGYIYSLVEDWTVVEETLQETAVYMCEHWKDFTPGTDFGAWARTVAHNRCRELLHRENRQGRIKQSVSRNIPEEVWKEYSAYTPDRKKILDECVEALSEESRSLIAMRYEQGKSCSAVARAVSKSVDTVYMALSRIRQRLRNCVAEKS